MSQTWERIRGLIARGDVRISGHGYDELAADGLFATDAVDSIDHAVVVEDYPDYPKGPCVLTRQIDRQGRPIHVLWGIPVGHDSPAVLVTVYQPDPERWDDDFLRRRS